MVVLKRIHIKNLSVDEINQKIGLMPLIAPYLMEQKNKI